MVENIHLRALPKWILYGQIETNNVRQLKGDVMHYFKRWKAFPVHQTTMVKMEPQFWKSESGPWSALFLMHIEQYEQLEFLLSNSS